ncbi:MAG: cobalamin-dependent protein [Candidatus Aminicenantes bacterium]|jgi:radical SAM superfamily enzyme YgiQ (UPF0313 family)
MKILLVQPSEPDTVLSRSMIIEPLGMESIAGQLGRDHDIRLLDMRFDQNFHQALQEFSPDVLGITGVTADYYLMQQMFKQAKERKPEIVTIAGGPHPTMVPTDFNLPEVDVTIIGDGELKFKQVIRSLETRGDLQELGNIPGIAWHGPKGFEITSKKLHPVDISVLEIPNRDISRAYRQNYFRGTWKPLAASYSTRGCDYRCDFCCTWRLAGGRFQTRGVENFINDLASIEEPYVFLAEDNTIGDPQYSMKLYEAVKASGIRKSYQFYARSDEIIANKQLMANWKSIGMKLVLIGMEMASDQELNAVNKNNTTRNNEAAVQFLKSIDVETISYFLIDPAFTDEDFKRLTDYVLKLQLSHPVYFILTPLPGTTLYQQRKSQLITHDYTKFDFFHCVSKTTLPQHQFYERFIQLYRDTYLKRDASEAEKSVFDSGIVGNLLKNLEIEYAEELIRN